MKRVFWIMLLFLALCGTSCRPRVEMHVWEEPFDEAGSWRLSADASAETRIEDGQLRIRVREPGQIAWATAGKRYANFRLQVEATPFAGPDDNEYGVLVRMDGDKHFYAFSISADGYARVARYADGRWELLSPDWFPHSAVAQGMATNRLELAAEGGQFRFWVNGELVAEVADAALTQGDVGLYAGAFDAANVRVAFDNLRIEPLR